MHTSGGVVVVAQAWEENEVRTSARWRRRPRDFTVLLRAMLREAGVPAKARCGFANYFADGFFDDHWVVEVWDGDRGWRLVDAQVAGAPKGTYRNDFDPLDVPRDAFLVAGRAWLGCRAGRRDPGPSAARPDGPVGAARASTGHGGCPIRAPSALRQPGNTPLTRAFGYCPTGHKQAGLGEL